MLSVTDADDRPPIEQALEVFVYAPLGFALEARTLLPRFIERGRNQVVLARVIGKYAVARGAASAEGAAVEAQERTLSILRQVGFLPPNEPTEPPPVPGDDHGDPAGLADGTTGVAVETLVTGPLPEVGTLAIPDYDSLSASQVVPRLESLAPDELEAVRCYEQGTRSRKTILSKIAQLQAV